MILMFTVLSGAGVQSGLAVNPVIAIEMRTSRGSQTLEARGPGVTGSGLRIQHSIVP